MFKVTILDHRVVLTVHNKIGKLSCPCRHTDANLKDKL